MKHPLKRLFTILAGSLAMLLQGAVPVSFTASPSTPPYVPPPIPHGSAIEFTVTLTNYTSTAIAAGADTRLWFQTNGMGSTWFSAPATLSGNVITATFGPDQDTGADRVSCFFGAPSNVFASSVLRLTHAPGFSPTELDTATRTLDFSAYTLTNIVALTNGWVFGTEVDLSDYYTKTETDALSATKRDMTNLAYYASGVPGLPTTTNDFFGVSAHGGAETLLFDYDGTSWSDSAGDLVVSKKDAVYEFDNRNGKYYDPFTFNLSAPDYTFTTNVDGYAIVITGYVPDRLALASSVAADISAAATSAANYTDTAVNATTITLATLYGSSNVVAEVTNYNSQVHAPTLRLMQLDGTNGYITVWTETNGLSRIARASTNYTDQAVSNAELRAATTYAPKAWSRTTSGMGVEAPSNTTWVSTEKTVLAGGLEFQSVGQIWVLTYNGITQVYTNQASNLRMAAIDGTEIFAVEKPDSYLVGVAADSISVSGSVVTMTLNVVAPEHPYLRYTPVLTDTNWQKEEDGFTSDISAAWSGTSGAWTCAVTTTATQGFFFFEYYQEGGIKITNKGAMDVSAGILCTDGVHKCRPVYNNGSITWEVVQ